MLHKFCFFLGLKFNWLVKILQNSHWPWDDSTEWCGNSKTWLFFFEKTSLVKLSELTEPKVQQCEHQISLNHTWVFSCCSYVDIFIWFLSDEFWNEQLQTALFKVGHATRLWLQLALICIIAIIVIIITRPRHGLGWDHGARIQFVLLLWLTELPLFVENTTFAMYGFGMDQD